MVEVNLGFVFQRDSNEPAPPSNAIMSIVGLCGPAKRQTIAGETSGEVTARDAQFVLDFPLNTPVMFNSTDELAATIEHNGYIGDALSAINNQLGRMQRSARVIFVRVADPTGADDAAKLQSAFTNIIGSSASGTGIYAFKKAGAICGAYPRLVCIPGYTSQIVSPATANPVVAALPAVLNSYLGTAVVDLPGDTEAHDIAYRETVLSERIIGVTPGVKVFQDSSVVNQSAAARVIGLAVRRDFEAAGWPFLSWCNQPIYGIIGPTRAIDFSLTDGDTQGQDYLGHQIGPIVRGESGDDFAIADGGFNFLGYENMGADLIWRQYHKVRGRDFVELTALRTLRYYLGKYNLTLNTVTTVVETIDNLIKQAISKGYVLGGLSRFDPSLNNADDLRTGKIYVDMRFEEAPMFREAQIMSRPYRPALDATIAALSSSTILAEPLV